MDSGRGPLRRVYSISLCLTTCVYTCDYFKKYSEHHVLVEASELWCYHTFTRTVNGHTAMSLIRAVGKLAPKVPSDRIGNYIGCSHS
jgi:hypothetical protein